MWPFQKNKTVFWNDIFYPLIVYNSEVYRGILHTEEYKEKMNQLQ